MSYSLFNAQRYLFRFQKKETWWTHQKSTQSLNKKKISKVFDVNVLDIGKPVELLLYPDHK